MKPSRYAALAAVVGAAVVAPPVATAASKVVYAGGSAKFQKQLFPAVVDSYLNGRVTIHAGDSVVWNGASLQGGFHTVDIPKLNGTLLPLFTSTGKVTQGVKDAAGNPFWFNGKLPVLSFNTQLFGASGGTVYNGTTRIESGLPLAPKPHDFKVTFTTPGTYRYFCDVHPGMVGYVVVKPKKATIPTAKQDAAALAKQQKADAATVKRLTKTKVAANTFSLGAADGKGVEFLAMLPSSLTVSKGATVRFTMPRGSFEVHTATFGPKSYLTDLANAFTSPAFPMQGVYPSDPPGHIVLTSATHGNGFAGTGVLDQNPATQTVPSSGGITFGQAGTYHFICLIHPFMQGTVVVK